MLNFDTLTQDDINDCLNEQSEETSDIPPKMLSENSRQAAVLIPFLRIEESWHILYIRRSEYEGDHHSGQVAFAGGKREKEDHTLEKTALREAEEEIGIKTSDAMILGKLNQHYTVSDFQVTPYIATLQWPYPLNLDKTEVARAFTIPLNWLSNPKHYQIKQRFFKPSKKAWPVVYYNTYDNELLWGATARMTLSLIDTLKRAL